MRKNVQYIVVAFLMGFALSAEAGLPKGQKENNNTTGGGNPGTGGQHGETNFQDCNLGTSRATLDINNVRALIWNTGDMWWNRENLPQYEVPKVDDPSVPKKNALFAGSIWIGGIDPSQGNILTVSAQTYGVGAGQFVYWPGPTEGGFVPGEQRDPNVPEPRTQSASCRAWDQVFKVNNQVILDYVNSKPYVDFAEGRTPSISPNDIPDEILNWPGRNNPFLAGKLPYMDQPLARFQDFDGPSIGPNAVYDPTTGDYPLLPGAEFGSGADQVIFYVMNDVGNQKFLSAGQSTTNIGLEFHIEAFAYATSDGRNNMTFYRNKIINKGSFTMDSCVFGQWVDPDLGNPQDDYVGCDIERGLGICYNGDNNDEGIRGYGEDPPAIGVDFFIGPIADTADGLDNDRDGWVDEGTDGIDNNCDGRVDWDDVDTLSDGRIRYNEREKIVMSNFLYYNNSNDPVNGGPTQESHFYNYLRNRWKTGVPATYDLGNGTTSPNEVAPKLGSQPPLADFMFPGNTDYRRSDGESCGNTNKPVNNKYWSTPEGEQMPSWTETVAGNPPADRRFLQSAGPFTLKPGQINDLIIGVVWAEGGRTNGGDPVPPELKSDDDKAQKLFDNDFQILNGPNAPDLEVVELDEELILTIKETEFSLTPRERYTQSTYEESVQIGNQITKYRFEGYMIYQLAGPDVGVNEIGDPNKARKVAHVDVKNGVTNIFNTVLDPVTGLEVKSGTPPDGITNSDGDQGIRKVFRVTRDLFGPGEGKLVNFRKYYYTVVAYAYNPDEPEEPYLQGRRDVRTYEAIPHKTQPENRGTILNSSFGDYLDVRKLKGIGNGRNFLNLDMDEADSILIDGSKQQVDYVGGSSPVTVRIYNPKEVSDLEMKVQFSSRLDYVGNVPGDIAVGDTIECVSEIAPPDDSTWDVLEAYALTNEPQTPGVAIVKRIDADNNRMEVQLLNADKGGTFTVNVERFAVDTVQGDTSYNAYLELSGEFSKRGSNAVFRASRFQANGFYELLERQDDGSYTSYFEVSEGLLRDDTTYKRMLAVPSEEVLSKYGLSINVDRGYNPGYRYESATLNPQNGFRGAQLEYTNPDEQYIEPVPQSELQNFAVPPFVLTGAPSGGAARGGRHPYDPFGAYNSVLSGSWAPYAKGAGLIVNGSMNYGPTKAFGDEGIDEYVLNNFPDVPSVDVVLTPDKDKWTRCVVLQMGYPEERPDDPLAVEAFFRHLSKSRQPSVDKNFTPDGSLSPYDNAQPSLGMSWFPGYAIDVEHGTRLNMVFAESIGRVLPGGSEELVDNGNNLIWEPTDHISGSRNYVYVLKTPYDEGRALERKLDSLNTEVFPEDYPGDVAAGYEMYFYRGLEPEEEAPGSPIFWSSLGGKPDSLEGAFEDFVWAGNMRVPSNYNQPIYDNGYTFSSDVRIKLRVDHAWRAYDQDDSDDNPNYPDANDAPEFYFASQDKAVIKNNAEAQKSALDLIRVVPNPYYAYSQYETSRLDNRVKITNLPTRCNIQIYNLSGSLIREFRVDDNTKTFIDWDLRNAENLPIASGLYLIHIEAPEIGEEKVIKWFGALRPVDLESLN